MRLLRDGERMRKGQRVLHVGCWSGEIEPVKVVSDTGGNLVTVKFGEHYHPRKLEVNRCDIHLR